MSHIQKMYIKKTSSQRTDKFARGGGEMGELCGFWFCFFSLNKLNKIKKELSPLKKSRK